VLVTLFVAALVAGCSTPQGDLSAVTASTSALQPPDKFGAASAGPSEDYEIQPLDVLDISVFQVPELTKTVSVSSSGAVTLPLIGGVSAAGRTARELEAEIATKLRADYLQAPQVSIFVKEQPSQQVTVDGAVKAPGVYPVRGKMTLVQVIASAGGLDRSIADARAVIVLRRIDGRVQAAKFDYEAISAGQAEDPVMYAGDIIKVDRSGVRAALNGLKSVIPIFSVFTPF